MTSYFGPLLLLLIACTTKEPMDCSRAREGRFTDVIATGETTQVLRTLTEQRERTSGMGEVRLSIRWLDDCTYQLFDREVVGREKLFPTNHVDTVIVHIISSDEKGFYYEAEATFAKEIIKGHQLYEQ